MKVLLLLTPLIFLAIHSFAQCTSCTYTISSSGTYSQTVNAGETLCITGNTTISSTSYIGLKNGANMTFCSSGTDTIRMNINISTGGGSPGPITIRNYSNLVYGQNTGLDSKLTYYNYKYLKVQGYLNAFSTLYNADTAHIIVTDYINTAGTITNDGNMEIGTYGEVGSTWIQNGTLSFGGYLNLSNGSHMDATGTTNVGSNMMLTNNMTSNGAVFHVAGMLSVNSGGSLNLSSALFISRDLEIHKGPITSTGCSSFLVSNSTNITGGTFSGQIHITDSTTTGTDTLDANSCSSCGFTAGMDNPCFQVLPVELMYFKGWQESVYNKLIWSTATERNNSFFTVERASGGDAFEPIAIIEGAGNSSNILNYSYYDNKALPGLSYYRLKQTDFDGTFSYSNIIVIKRDGLEIVNYNSLEDNTIGLTVYSGNTRDIKIQIMDLQGRVRLKDIYTVVSGTNKIILPVLDNSSGIYVLQVQSGMENSTIFRGLLVSPH